MKLKLDKIVKFYNGDLGQYIHPKIEMVLSRHLPSMGEGTNIACVGSAGLFPYQSLFDNSCRLALQMTDDRSASMDDVLQKSDNFIAIDPGYWPYRAEEVDCVILMHDIEFMNDPEVYLREAWRVLKGEGQLIIVFPNRQGAWARSDNNPFGQGYPFTISQMRKILSKVHFMVDKIEGSLYHPPYKPKTKMAHMVFSCLEYIGRVIPFKPGVVTVSASKHIYAPTNGLKVMDAAHRATQAFFPKPATFDSSHKLGD